MTYLKALNNEYMRIVLYPKGVVECGWQRSFVLSGYFQSAASSEYIDIQTMFASRFPIKIGMRADVTSALRMRSHSLIRGDKAATRIRYETARWARRTASQTL